MTNFRVIRLNETVTLENGRVVTLTKNTMLRNNIVTGKPKRHIWYVVKLEGGTEGVGNFSSRESALGFYKNI